MMELSFKTIVDY